MELYGYEKRHLSVMDELLPECTLFLKRNNAFPIKKACKVALYGKGARHTVKGGTGSGDVNSHFVVTIEQGLKDAGFEITSDKWLDAYDKLLAKQEKLFFKQVRKEAKAIGMNPIWYGMGAECPEFEYDLEMNDQADIAIYVLSRVSGEGKDRNLVKGDYYLTDTEVKDILALNARYEKFMLVLNVGAPIDLTQVNEVNNILLLSELGAKTGTAFANILCGKQNPSGKLSSTWALSDIEFAKEEDTNYYEDIYVGYRYFDTKGIEVTYPFGYGLSYTSFIYELMDVSYEDKLVLKVNVSNTGNYPGKEVIQCYVSKPNDILKQAKKELIAFNKTNLLNPGETQCLTLEIDVDDCASFDDVKARWTMLKGDYQFYVGNSSNNVTSVCKIHVSERHSVLHTKHVENMRLDNVLNIEFDRNDIECPSFEYKPKEKITLNFDQYEHIKPFVKSLSDKDLVKCCMGSFKVDGSLVSVIGDAGSTVAGAAGETADVAGLEKIVMADGPAGLRLTQHCAKDDEGVVSRDGHIAPTFSKYMTKLERMYYSSKLRKPKKNAECFDQYATALPIGTAIAQSFSNEVARLCGDIVGREMKRFKVHLWLAPALNIHRSPLCGRNFEYYSEDPVLSGMMAASITNGVQRHGVGVVIKHYCANNQETNRYSNSSNMTERALREIYLKGFEICVKTSKPMGVMTSYNLLNGVHTSERKDLMDILKCEFGFDGIVMTDWVIHSDMSKMKYPDVEAYRIMNTGSNLVMPGSKQDYDNLLNALKDNLITRERLEKNVTQLIEVAHQLNK